MRLSHSPLHSASVGFHRGSSRPLCGACVLFVYAWVLQNSILYFMSALTMVGD